MQLFAATPSNINKQYISGIHPANHLISGQPGMWVVWDVMVGQNGYFARLVPEHNGQPLGFSPCMANGKVWGYLRHEDVFNER
ncbi:MAG: hypothetical protein HQL68_00080 [Magnetococcales bacterium]|nr:hypothetical protein [Magnetococcales bacterium]